MPRSLQAWNGASSNARQQDASWHWQDQGWHDEGTECWYDRNQAWAASCNAAPEQEERGHQEATESWYEREQALHACKRVAQEQSHDRSEASKNPKPSAPADHNTWILKAQEYHVDGNWYVELAETTWKLVTQPAYCQLCDMDLEDEQDHIGSKMHRIKLALKEEASPAQQPSSSPVRSAVLQACTVSAAVPLTRSASPHLFESAPQLPPAPVPSATPTCHRAASPHRLAPLSQPAGAPPQDAASSERHFVSAPLQDWEEITPDGFRRCKACNKYLDGRHEEQAGHKERVHWWMQYRITKMAGFPAPQESWLAWVPEDNGSGDRHLKCLLCQKSTDAKYPDSHSHSQPARATSWHHSGCPDTPAGSKEHKTKLRNYESLEHGPIEEERLRCHPEAAADADAGAAPAPAAPHQAGTAGDTLPPAWKAALDPEGRTYYCNYLTGEARWKMPTLNPLPAGWEAATDTERNVPYYYHVATGKSQWQHPAVPEMVD